MIKTWKERCSTRISERPSDNFQKEMQAEIDELCAKLAESEQCLQSAIDNNLNKLLAMSDEQVTALTRLEGSNPADVAALARKTMELAAANVKLNECSRLYEAALKREFDLAQKLGALEKQQPTAWMYDWECEGELVKNWMTTDNEEAHSLPNGCHNIRPLFLSAGAAPVCTSDEWLANCPQSVRDLANKIKAGAAPVQPMIAFRHGCPTCGKLEGCEHAAAPVQPNKWTAEEIERGYVGLRWVTKEGVAGRPTNHDVYAYLKTLPEESRCVCEGCRTAGAAPKEKQ